MINDTLIKLLAVLLAARNPSPNTVAQNSTRPSGDMGVDITGSVKLLAEVQCRADLQHKTAEVEVGVLDAASTYRITLGATNYDSTSNTVLDILGDLETAINGGSQATATLLGTTLYIEVTLDEELAVEVSTVGGTGTLVLVQDTESVTFTIFVGKEISNGVWLWVVPRGADALTTAGDGLNWGERVDCAGYTRAWVSGEAAEATGRWTAYVSPCITE